MDATQLFHSLDSTYLYLERYVNGGSPSGFTQIHKTSEETNPFTGQDRFALLRFKDDDLETRVIGRELPPFWDRQVNYAHPDSQASQILLRSGRILEPSDIVVSPTSGGRTMFVWNRTPSGYLKLTYDVARIGRVDRQLSYNHCLASYEASETLKSVADRGKFPSTLAVQLETTAKVSYLRSGDEVYEWGVIFREKQPYPYLNGVSQLVPGFSLFHATKYSVDKPLIVQFIELGHHDPLRYLMDLLKVIVDGYWSIVLNCGFLIECHGQNCLFEVDQNFKVLRIVIRDMDSVDKDIPLAEYLGLNTQWQSYPQCCMDRNVHFYDIRASYIYDYKVGEYLFSPIINAVAGEYGLDVEGIQADIRSYVRANYLGGLPPTFFPEDGCWYDCDNTERLPGTRRIYTAHNNPKFR